MKFHARFDPGIVTDADQAIRLVIHEPRKASGVTVKIWELGSFVGAEGAAKRQEGKTDLLATLTGDIEPARDSRQTRVFKVTNARITTEDKDKKLATIKLAVSGTETVYTLPLPSEGQEAEGRSREIGFSIEQGGAEVFRTRAPCFFHPQHVFPTAIACRHDSFDEEQREEEILRLRHVCIGFSEGEGMKARLNILTTGYIDLQGHLVDGPPEDGEPPPQPLALRHDRELFAYVHVEPAGLAAGHSKIPIAICDPIEPDGTIRHRLLTVEHPFGLVLGERKLDVDADGLKIGPHQQLNPIPEVAADVLDEMFRRMGAALRGDS